MGVWSAELPANTTQNFLADTNSATDVLYGGDFTGSKDIVKSSDGTTTLTTTQTWSRDEIHRRIVQTKADGSQFRVGYQRLSSAGVPINATIQWGSWTNFDGSMGPATILKMFYSATTPKWKQLVAVSNKSMTDAEILKAFGYWRF